MKDKLLDLKTHVLGSAGIVAKNQELSIIFIHRFLENSIEYVLSVISKIPEQTSGVG